MSLIPNSTNLAELSRVFREIDLKFQSLLKSSNTDASRSRPGLPGFPTTSIGSSGNGPNGSSVNWDDLLNVPSTVSGIDLILAGKEAKHARATTRISTATLAAGATDNVSIQVSKTCSILAVSVDYPAWVRIYQTSSARTNDASRLITVDPPSCKGVVVEYLLEGDHLTIWDSNPETFSNGDSPANSTAYIAVTNKDSVSRLISVTVTYLSQEE